MGINKGPAPSTAVAATGARVVLADKALSGAFAQLTFSSTDYDTGSYVSGNTFVIPATGLYMLCTRCYTGSPNANDYIILGYSVNSASQQAEHGYIQAANSATALRCNAAVVLQFTAADIVRVFYQSTNSITGAHASITRV